MKSTFSVIYYLKRQVVKKDGTVPVMGRITVDGSQTQFSCKLTVDPKLWDTKGGRVTGRSTAALETNRMLDKMRVRINKHYQEIMERDNFVTAEKVKNAFLGLEHRYHTLLQVFRQHNEDYAKQVEAGMKAKGTFDKYKIVYKHLQEFLTIRYHVKDIALKELTPPLSFPILKCSCARTNTAAPTPCGCMSARFGRWCSSPSTTSGSRATRSASMKSRKKKRPAAF